LKYCNLVKTEQLKDVEFSEISIRRDSQIEMSIVKKIELESNVESLLTILRNKKSELATKKDLITKKNELVKDLREKIDGMHTEKKEMDLNLTMQEDSITHKRRRAKEMKERLEGLRRAENVLEY
jgi:hypothetical protein